MPTVIDALVVSLGLDATKFTAGQKQASAALDKTKQQVATTSKAVDAHSSKIVAFFDALNNPIQAIHGHFRALASQATRMGGSVEGGAKAGAAGLVAMGAAGLSVFAVLKGIKGLSDQAIKDAPATAGTARIARNVGIPTKTLSAWEIAASEAVGANKEDVSSAFTSITQEIARLHLGGQPGPALQAMMRLGVPLGGTPDKMMLETAHALHALVQRGEAPTALALGRQMGLSDPMPNFLERGRLAVEAQLAKARPAAETDAQATAAKRLVTATNSLEATFAAVERNLEQRMTPALIVFENWLTKNLPWLAKDLTTPLKDTESGKALIAEVKKMGGPAWTWFQKHALGENPDGSSISAPSGTPRGIANNNPLNLSYVPGQIGLDPNRPSDGRFGRYVSMDAGVASAERQLLRYQASGLTTVRQMVSKWAPPSENDTGSYVKQVAAAMGVSPDAPVDLRDPRLSQLMISAMAQRETGRRIDSAVVSRGVGAVLGLPAVATAAPAPSLPPMLPGTALTAAGQRPYAGVEYGPLPLPKGLRPADLHAAIARLPTGAQLAAAQAATRGGDTIHNHNDNGINVGGVTVNAKSADARGIARETATTIRNTMLVTQANSGLT